MTHKIVWFLTVVVLLLASKGNAVGQLTSISLTALDLRSMRQGWGGPKIDSSISGGPLQVAGKRYSKGIGTHAASAWLLNLKGQAVSFTAKVGVDDAGAEGISSLEFVVIVDGEIQWRSGRMVKGDSAQDVVVPLESSRFLELYVSDLGDGTYLDHANWLEATITMKEGVPDAWWRPWEATYFQTPPEPVTPRLNTVGRYGLRPNREMLYRVPCAGKKPISILVENLPPGLSFDSESQIISGRVANRGVWRLNVTASNQHGMDRREIDLVVGDTISLTPPVGWSSWYAYFEIVSEDNVRETMDQLFSLGLVEYGFDNVNIDDGWQGLTREPDSTLLPDAARFTDMKKLVDDAHLRGLKVGLYSSPGKLTCQKKPGNMGFEVLDAETYCRWGIDYFKSDVCSLHDTLMAIYHATGESSVSSAPRFYKRMGDALEQCDRDIHFNIAPYGLYDVWLWSADSKGHSFRTRGDIYDEWWSMSNDCGFSQDQFMQYSRPGSWADADHLRVGPTGHTVGKRPSNLSADESYTHVSLWALLKTPFLIGGHLVGMDTFALQLLKNAEVMDLVHDGKGVPGRRIWQQARRETWAMPLSDGSWAVGLFNRDGFQELPAQVNFAELGIPGDVPCRVRDLWRQRDISTNYGTYSAVLPRHGCKLIRVFPNQISSTDASDMPAVDLVLEVSPNPTTGLLKIRPVVKKGGIGNIDVYDLTGTLVSRVKQGFFEPGTYEYTIDIESSGTFVVRMTLEGRVVSRSVTVVR